MPQSLVLQKQRILPTSKLSFLLLVHISKEYLQLEPIGLVFVFFFALILVIQFTAMLFHRFGTISHILASTELNLCKKKSEDLSQDALIDKMNVNQALYNFAFERINKIHNLEQKI
uniref:Uncharacterized protein n=1 Tax=Megaselia scalaris TaxID=36166 RepID=T1GKX1_MEGSC